jgi:MoaA/NifB/PqqE/SkfB family radical SAM enzyme
MSTGAYSPSKALAWPDRLQALRDGKQPYPVHLHFIISDTCDLDCPQCPYRMSDYPSNQMFGERRQDGAYTHNPKRMLEWDLIKSVLEDCKLMGTQAIEFTGGGEPTIHPDAPEALYYAQHLGLDTALITNGLHMPRMGEGAVKTQWLRISIDAATPETYAVVRPSYSGPDRARTDQGRVKSYQNFHKAWDAVSNAAEMKRSLGTDCLIGAGFVVQRENRHEIRDFVRLAKERGADNVRISGAFTTGYAAYHADYRQETEEQEREAIREFSSESFKVYGRFHEKMDDLVGRPDYPTCWYQQLTTYLGGDGNLYRCCVTSYNRQGLIGNVREAGGFKALWDSEIKKRRIAGFDAKTCVTCNFNDRNRAIDAALKADPVPTPPDMVHKSFV